ncbi:hypothetical protein HK105_208879 [Polyrhizophydium stewartii]|uniref:RanBP2-type domain-containing protein n=1 Tax=Polyrhizophydium stewartii TaxID=2732419 RepID=A0ABR4MWS1_9FUNG
MPADRPDAAGGQPTATPGPTGRRAGLVLRAGSSASGAAATPYAKPTPDERHRRSKARSAAKPAAAAGSSFTRLLNFLGVGTPARRSAGAAGEQSEDDDRSDADSGDDAEGSQDSRGEDLGTGTLGDDARGQAPKPSAAAASGRHGGLISASALLAAPTPGPARKSVLASAAPSAAQGLRQPPAALSQKQAEAVDDAVVNGNDLSEQPGAAAESALAPPAVAARPPADTRKTPFVFGDASASSHAFEFSLGFLASRRGQTLTDDAIEAFMGILGQGTALPGDQSAETRQPMLFSRPVFASQRMSRSASLNGPPSSTSSTHTSVSKIRISRKPVHYAGSGFGVARTRPAASKWGGASASARAPGTPLSKSAPILRPRAPAESSAESPAKRLKTSGSITAATSSLLASSSAASFPESSGLQSKPLTSAAQTILSTLDEVDAPPTNTLMPFGSIKPLPNPYIGAASIPTVDLDTTIPEKRKRSDSSAAEGNAAKASHQAEPEPPVLVFSSQDQQSSAVFKPTFKAGSKERKQELAPEQVTPKAKAPAIVVADEPKISAIPPFKAPVAFKPPVPKPVAVEATPFVVPSKPAAQPANALAPSEVFKLISALPTSKLPSFSFVADKLSVSELPPSISVLSAWQSVKQKVQSLPNADLPKFEFHATATSSSAVVISVATKPKSSGWTCNACLVPNPADAKACVACETPAPSAELKAAAAPASISFGGFGAAAKPKSSGRTCSACLVPNPADAKACVACETPAPSAEPKAAAAPASISFGGFGAAAKPKSSGWTCNACLVPNPADAKACVACETPAPSAEPKAAAAPASISFGGFGAAAKPKSSGWTCSVCLVPNPADSNACIACTNERPK